MHLANLPALESLIADGNGLCTLAALSENAGFTSLKALSLNNNKIESWSNVDHLNSFPALVALQLSENPVIVPEEGLQVEANTDIGVYEIKYLRHIAIARLPRLQTLNHTDVAPVDRVAAERQYVVGLIHELKKVNENCDNPPIEFNRLHPRYRSLLITHAESLMGVRAEPDKKTLKAGTNKCLLICNVKGAKVPAKPVEKRLSSTMKVSQVKIMCKKLFGVDPASVQLYFKGKQYPSPIPIEDDVLSELGADVTEGGDIIIEHVDDDTTAVLVASKSEQYSSVMAHPQFAEALFQDGSGMAQASQTM